MLTVLKICDVPIHPAALRLVEEYLEQAGHREERSGPIFRTLSNNRDEDNPAPLSQSSLYRNVIKKCSLVAGLDVARVSNHTMRATSATNALSNSADIAKVQEWLGHANVSSTELYDRRPSKPEDSPTFPNSKPTNERSALS
ncbi:MAG: site-specific integrase [Akkermansiaceae bacterium]